MKKYYFFCVSGLLIIMLFSTEVYSQLNPKDTVRKIQVYFKTSNDIFSGTDNDVWFDIGTKAWRINLANGFKKGGLDSFIVDDPSRLTYGVSGYKDALPVPLRVGDIKIIRIEKKGIRPCDIIPGWNAGECDLIGGLSNAPDSKEELLSPIDPTPEGQVRLMKENIGTAEAELIQLQGALKIAQDSFHIVGDALNKIKDKIIDLKKTISNIPQQAMQDYNRMQSVQEKLITDKVSELVDATVCDNHIVWKIIRFGFFGPISGWVTESVCHAVKKINPVFADATNEIQKLRSNVISEAGQVGAKALEDLSKEESKLTDFNKLKIALDVYLSALKPALEDVRKRLADLKLAAHQLDVYIKEKLPFLTKDLIPLKNQWKLERIVVLINGKEFRSYPVNHRFKQGKSSWTVTTENNMPDEYRFLNELRVNKNTGGNSSDGISAAFTSPLFKEREISGWDDDPLGYGTIIGTLVNEPNRGYDGFVSLDMLIDTMYLNNKKFILDGKHGISHQRFIRCEYLRVKADNSVDNSFNDLKVGQHLKISGEIQRDLDRQTYFELHPINASEVQIITSDVQNKKNDFDIGNSGLFDPVPKIDWKSTTVCTIITGVHTKIKAGKSYIFLELSGTEINNKLSIMILKNDADKFSYKLTTLLGKYICVTGPIKDFNGNRELIVNNESQIILQ